MDVVYHLGGRTIPPGHPGPTCSVCWSGHPHEPSFIDGQGRLVCPACADNPPLPESPQLPYDSLKVLRLAFGAMDAATIKLALGGPDHPAWQAAEDESLARVYLSDLVAWLGKKHVLTELEQTWYTVGRYLPTVDERCIESLVRCINVVPPEARSNVANPQEYLGKVGDRIELELNCLEVKELPEDPEYGRRFLVLFDKNCVWFTGENCSLEEGKRYNLRGTIKSHGYYGRRPQTVLSRVKEYAPRPTQPTGNPGDAPTAE